MFIIAKAVGICFCTLFLGSILLNVYFIGGNASQDAEDMGGRVGRGEEEHYGEFSTSEGKPVGAEVRASWHDIADSLLCSTGGDASQIRDGLKVTDSSAHWIVLTT